MTNERFPIQGGPSIPWAMIAPYESQARANHDQSLKRLAERGGLSPCEAIAVLDCKAWWFVRGMPEAEALAEIERRRQVFERPGPRRTPELHERCVAAITDVFPLGGSDCELAAKRVLDVVFGKETA